MERLTEEELEKVESLGGEAARLVAEARASRSAEAVAHGAANVVAMPCGSSFPGREWKAPPNLASDAWRSHVPESVRHAWGRLTDEGRGVAYLVAREAAEREKGGA